MLVADATTGPASAARVGAVHAQNVGSEDDAGNVSVAPFFPHGVVIVRGGNHDSAIPFGSSRREGETLICGIRPGETMFIGRPDAVSTQVASSGDADSPGTVDISHSRSVFEVTGPSATNTLEKVCSLDWGDAMMPDGACGSASVAKISCDVIRADDGIRRRYLVICGRSWGQYLHESLLDAAAEFSA